METDRVFSLAQYLAQRLESVVKAAVQAALVNPNRFLWCGLKVRSIKRRGGDPLAAKE